MTVRKLVLQNSTDLVFQSLLSETWCSAVLDSVATSTVCSKHGFDECLKNLPSEQESKVTYSISPKPFRFDRDEKLTSFVAATISATICSCKLEIKSDVINIHKIYLRFSYQKLPLRKYK